MGRTKGVQNKQTSLPHYSSLSTEERLKFIANLIVDRIEVDQQGGKAILKILEGKRYAKQS